MKHTLAATLVALSFAFAFTSAEAQDRKPVTPQAGQSGRFVIVVSPVSTASIFLLDTETGKVWRPVQFTAVEGEPVLWQYMERVDTPEQLSEWFARQRAKPRANP